MDLFCEKTGTEKRYVQGWLPIVAAAQLAYKRPEEKDLLESWINVSSINKFYLHIEAAPPESGLQIYGQKRQVLYWPVFLIKDSFCSG